MSTTEQQLKIWMDELQQYHLPRWNELPDIELYMDQVITLIERYLSPLVDELGEDKNKVITSAMINNYVKLGIMPKPYKKRYERIHLAHLIVITILKQVILIPEVKQGIYLQSIISGNIENAYNLFCDELEDGLRVMIRRYRADASYPDTITIETVGIDRLGLHMSCISMASKIITEKVINLRVQEYAAQKDAAKPKALTAEPETYCDTKPNQT